jgi:hypothetical protein
MGDRGGAADLQAFLTMSDFNVRSDSVDVEQIMEQIRARIREKRGVDYTEQQIRELAAVKLEKLLDPRGVRSDLLTRFKERQPEYVAPLLPLYTFEDTTIYETHRGVLQWIRRALNPILKLFFNPNAIIHALHAQVEINKLNLEREAVQEKRRIEMETLYYELVHNLVFELTRVGIETKNLKLRVESIASRLEFNERRARALESVVVYKPSGEAPSASSGQAASTSSGHVPSTSSGHVPSTGSGQAVSTGQGQALSPGSGQGTQEGPGQRSRRRRRRRGRRGGAPASTIMGASTVGPPTISSADHSSADQTTNSQPDQTAAPAAPDRSVPTPPPGGSDPDQ